MSNSKNFLFIRLKANAAAEALKTEKSKAPLMPVEKVMDKAKRSIKTPLSFANNSVLKPRIRQMAKRTSAAVARIPTAGINELGIHGLINSV